eukprot:scaffold6769_cov48-Phaeocystis_antarctica.AAC.1
MGRRGKVVGGQAVPDGPKWETAEVADLQPKDCYDFKVEFSFVDTDGTIAGCYDRGGEGGRSRLTVLISPEHTTTHSTFVAVPPKVTRAAQSAE